MNGIPITEAIPATRGPTPVAADRARTALGKIAAILTPIAIYWYRGSGRGG
jgi:hypothetical protein